MEAIYARQSVEREDSLSIEGQLARCRVELRGACREYVDRGYSGKNTNRPAFRRMMDDVRAGEVDRVIVYRLDRISRSILDFARMMELFERKGVEFLSSTEHFDTSTPMGRAMLNICIVFAQLERETIQTRVLDAYADRSRRGFYMGGRVPYGFALGELTICGVRTACYTPVEEEIAVVRALFEAYARPENTLGGLADGLRAAGVRSRQGRAWTGPRLRELLQNPIYCRADADVCAFYREQGTQIENPEADFIGRNGCYLFSGENGSKRTTLAGARLVLAPHEGVVDSGVWLTCRRRLLGNRRAASGRASGSWLTGRVRCARCGYALSVARSRSGRYFVCSGKRMGCGGLPTIRAGELEDAVEQRLLARAARLLTEEHPDTAALWAEERRCAQEMDEVIAAAAAPAPGALLRALERRADELERALTAVRARLDAENARTLDSVRMCWNGLDTGERRRVFAAFAASLRVDAEDILLEWRF